MDGAVGGHEITGLLPFVPNEMLRQVYSRQSVRLKSIFFDHKRERAIAYIPSITHSQIQKQHATYLIFSSVLPYGNSIATSPSGLAFCEMSRQLSGSIAMKPLKSHPSPSWYPSLT